MLSGMIEYWDGSGEGTTAENDRLTVPQVYAVF